MMQANSVSRTVEPIDWAHWEKTIQTPGVVAELKAQYEGLSFPKVEGYTPEVNATISKIKEDILTAKKQAVHGANEVKEVDKVVETVKKVKAEGQTWSLEQWHAFMPGLEEQHKAEYEDEDYLVHDEHLKLESVDWASAGKEFAKGEDPEMGEVDEKIGDLSTSEEMELVKQGKWSVARLFAGAEDRAKIQERVEKTLASVA